MTEFALNDYEFIELNKLLKILKLVGSGGQANMLITNKEVTVNGAIETQKRKKLRKGDTIVFESNSIVII